MWWEQFYYYYYYYYYYYSLIQRRFVGHIVTYIYPLLGNDTVNTFPWEPTRATIGRLFAKQRRGKHASSTKESVFSVVCANWLYRSVLQYRTVVTVKWQWLYYKPIARIRLVKPENHSAYATMNCNMCRSTIALYYL
jgi:hypothetical protein